MNHRAIARLHYLAEDAVQVSVSHCDLCLLFVTLLCYVFKFMINMVRSSAMYQLAFWTLDQVVEFETQPA